MVLFRIMELYVIAKCTYKMEIVRFLVPRSSSFVDICKTIHWKFKELCTRSFILKYSQPDCALQNENDFDMMQGLSWGTWCG